MTMSQGDWNKKDKYVPKGRLLRHTGNYLVEEIEGKVFVKFASDGKIVPGGEHTSSTMAFRHLASIVCRD